MEYALPVVPGFFPLDEALGLLAGSLTPHLQECLVRLGAWMPFGAAGELLRVFSGVAVSEASVRRQSERAGAALAAVQDEEAARIKEEMPPAPRGSEKQLLSVDGAMVPLLHGQWAEVKTLVIGEVEAAVQERGEWAVHSRALWLNSAVFAQEVTALPFPSPLSLPSPVLRRMHLSHRPQVLSSSLLPLR